jgi:hypothetical protein
VKPLPRQVTVTLPQTVWADLAARAAAAGVSVDTLIQAAIRADLRGDKAARPSSARRPRP